MLKLIRRRRRDGEKGQAMVEFAVLVPVFLLLLFAIVDFGMGFYSWISITNGAREGARIGAVNGTQADIVDKVYESVSLPDEGTKMSVTVTNASDAGGLPGEPVTVTVDYDYDLITPLSSIVEIVSGSALGSTISFSSTAEMRLE